MADSIAFLGTSDGLPSPDRFHASLLLKLGDQTILLDCGEPCSHSLKRLGIDLNAIDAVIVTHTHSDHIAGLPMLIQSMWLEQRARPLPIWLPTHAIRPLQTWLDHCYLFDAQLCFPIQWRELSEKSQPQVGKVRVRPFRTSHLDTTRDQYLKQHPAVGFDAFCLLIEGGGKRVGYSGDLGAAVDLKPLLEKPLDLLVVELAHFHPEKLFDVLRAREVHHVAITHMARIVRENFEKVQAMPAEAFKSRKVSFPRDGDVIEL